jgi:Na+-transporting NADH:ubiquinone oxidoreductase subunit NqrC
MSARVVAGIVVAIQSVIFVTAMIATIIVLSFIETLVPFNLAAQLMDKTPIFVMLAGLTAAEVCMRRELRLQRWVLDKMD